MALYYVAPGGSNGNNGTSTATPWQTLAFAIGATSPVVGGDTIYLRSGVAYTAGATVVRTGSVGNPIIIDTYPGDMPVKAQINTTGLYGIYCAISSSYTINNIDFAGSNGGAGIFFDDAPGLGVNDVWTIDRCIFANNVSGDNASGIFIQRQRGTITMTNNVFHDNLINPPNATSGYNATAVVVFGFINTGHPGACNINFQHNEVYNQAVGFKIKHLFATDNVFKLDVSYNLFYNITGRASIEVAGTDSTHTNAGNTKRVHHNLVINSTNGPALKSAADFGDWYTEWDHNTTYNCEAGFVAHREDASNESHQNNVHDNIWMPRTLAAPPVGYGVSLETTVAPLNTFDYNSFWNVTTTTTVATISGVGNQSFAGWQASTNLPDSHGARIDPLFVDKGTGGKTGDFHLQAGSTLRNSGSNGNDKGCYELRTEVMGPLPTGDTTAPVITKVMPSSPTTPATSVQLWLTTDEAASMRYSLSSGQAFASMTPFTSTGGTTHQTNVPTVQGQSYTYYCQAQDASGNTSADFTVTFLVEAYPVLSNGLPIGELPYGTTGVTLQVTSSEAVTARYSTSAGQTYDAMTNNFTTTGGVNHSVAIAGLTNGQTYTYYCRAREVAGPLDLRTPVDYAVTFSIASNPLAPPPVVSGGTLSPGVPITLVQNQAYTLPARTVYVLSTLAVDISLDGTTWRPLVNANAGGARTSAVYLRSPSVGCVVELSYRR